MQAYKLIADFLVKQCLLRALILSYNLLSSLNIYNLSSDLSMKTESQFWQEIIEPTSFMDHEALRDELQMHVLSYDDDVIKQDSFSGV